MGAAEWTESLCPPAIANIPVGLYVPLLEFNLDTEQKLGWAVYPPGNSGMAARIIVRLELFSVIGQAYPVQKDECCRQFRDEWNRWRAMVRPRGSDVVVDARVLGGVVE